MCPSCAVSLPRRVLPAMCPARRGIPSAALFRLSSCPSCAVSLLRCVPSVAVSLLRRVPPAPCPARDVSLLRRVLPVVVFRLRRVPSACAVSRPPAPCPACAVSRPPPCPVRRRVPSAALFRLSPYSSRAVSSACGLYVGYGIYSCPVVSLSRCLVAQSPRHSVVSSSRRILAPSPPPRCSVVFPLCCRAALLSRCLVVPPPTVPLP